MKYIEIYKLENNGDQKVVVTCSLVDGNVVCEGESLAIINVLNTEGIKDYENEGRLFPKDGERFLQQMKFNFKSGYMNASDVLEKN